MTLALKHDAVSDVLYATLPDASINASRPIEGDDFVIANMDRAGRVVGLQLIEACEMSVERWRDFFHTREIPEALFAAVETWLDEHTQCGGLGSSVTGIHSRAAG